MAHGLLFHRTVVPPPPPLASQCPLVHSSMWCTRGRLGNSPSFPLTGGWPSLLWSGHTGRTMAKKGILYSAPGLMPGSYKAENLPKRL